MAENLRYFEAYASVPENAQKPIKGGRLNGYTDINPMWRIKSLTEAFGPVGVGWYYKIIEKEIVSTDEGTAAFVDIELLVKIDGEWSMPIVGTGGSQLLEKERGGFHLNDECYKMALTDAISVACKALGFGSDIYWNTSDSKYLNNRSDGPDIKDMDIKEISTLKITFGKHKGLTLGELYKQDKNYVKWLCSAEETEQWLKDALSKLTQAAIEAAAKKRQEDAQ